MVNETLPPQKNTNSQDTHTEQDDQTYQNVSLENLETASHFMSKSLALMQVI